MLDKEEESFTKKVTSQVVDYLFELVVPLAILFYVAPQKSLNYVVDNAYSKASMITDINLNTVWNTTSDLINKTFPMLQMEGQAIGHVLEQSDDFFIAAYQSPWIDTLLFYWRFTLSVLALLTLAMLLFPWRKLLDWVADSIWRTIILFLGVLPLDDGLSTLSDSETGNYEIFIAVGSVILTLAINYLAWWSVWFILRRLGKVTLVLAAAGFRKVWGKAWGSVRGRRKSGGGEEKKTV